MGLNDAPKKRPKKRAPKPGAAAASRPKAEAVVEGERDEAAKKPAPKPSTDLGTRVSASISVIAAFVLATAVNIYASRHWVRWDFTKSGTFTLSQATHDTLASLPAPVKIIVLLPQDDALGVSVAEILDGYRAESDKLEIENVDPDRDQARLLEVQKRYGLLSGSQAGRVVTDAALIVVMGDEHRYVRHEDLVEVEDADDMRVRPRLEQAITGAIRGVRTPAKPRACFTTGHGEPSLDEGGEQGFAELRERLVKNNYEVAAVFQPTADAPKEPLAGCSLLILASPIQPVPKEDVAAMKRFIEGGGAALLAVGPVGNDSQTGWVDLQVDDLVALAGVTLQKDLIFEKDPSMRPVRGNGEIFFPKAQPHSITEHLVQSEARGQSAVFAIASSLRDAGSSVHPEPLLATSERAFGRTQITPDDDLSAPKDGDHTGPLTVAVAATRGTGGAKGGSRIVVFSAQNALIGSNWRAPEFAPNAALVEDAITWLTAREAFLDIPNKPAVTMGLRLSEDTLRQTLYYVVLGIPAVVVAAGVGIFMKRRRRSNVREGRRPHTQTGPAEDDAPKDDA
jgi:hypothetical protein